MSVELKIKSKHLGEEARIIRFEENKYLKRWQNAVEQHYKSGNNSEPQVDSNYCQYSSLRTHRTRNVRHENRATFLARAYIAGKPYKLIEQTRKPCYEDNFWGAIYPRVCDMVAKYGEPHIRKYASPGRTNVVTTGYTKLQEDIKQWCEL